MLVITRREAEEIVIGDPKDPIGVVRIASIKGDRVRVADPDGEAPAAVRRSSCRKVNLLINIGIGTEADPQILSKVHV